MGKLLETLQQTPAQQGAATAGATPVSAPAGVGEPQGAMSFIEVGGRQTPLEASPDVLAAKPSSRRTTLDAPHARGERGPRFQRLSAPAGDVRTVHFRPLEGPRGRAHARFGPDLVAFHRPEHAVSQQYHFLADSLRAQFPSVTCPTLLFTAPASGVGTTTVLLNLAITFARRCTRCVAVVDAQRDHPAVAERLGLTEAPGLAEVLAGNATLAQALQETGQEQLLTLTTGRLHGRSSGAWNVDMLRSLLRQLSERCELVLIDAPCWSGHPDVAVLAALCDAVYLVSSEEQAAETTRLVHAISQQGLPLRGQILTNG